MDRKIRYVLMHAVAAVAFGLAAGVSNAAGMDGISYLVNVTQMKAANASDDAKQGASKQRELAQEQQQLRKSQKSQEAKDRMGNFEIQNPMSQHNQSRKQQSHAQKKQGQTASGISQNIK
jgi:hypothetical protein